MAAAAKVGIVAMQGSSRWDTKVARCWRERRTFIWRRLKVKSPIIRIPTRYQRLP